MIGATKQCGNMLGSAFRAGGDKSWRRNRTREAAGRNQTKSDSESAFGLFASKPRLALDSPTICNAWNSICNADLVMCSLAKQWQGRQEKSKTSLHLQFSSPKLQRKRPKTTVTRSKTDLIQLRTKTTVMAKCHSGHRLQLLVSNGIRAVRLPCPPRPMDLSPSPRLRR